MSVAETATPVAVSPLRHPKVIAVVNPKGGACKTTTVVSLGYALAAAGRKTLLVDLDKQRSLTHYFGLAVEESESIGAVLSRTTRLDLEGGQPGDDVRLDAVLLTDIADQAGLDLLPSHERGVYQAELALQTDGVDGNFRLREVLDTAPLAHDVVLIDTPGNLGTVLINALVAADWVLVTSKPERGDVEEAIRVVDKIHAVRRRANPTLGVLGVVLTNVPNPPTNISAAMETVLRDALVDERGIPILKVRVARDTKVAEAAGLFQPVGAAFPTSRGAFAYKFLAEEVAQRIGITGEDQ